jgi:hypothetical protein
MLGSAMPCPRGQHFETEKTTPDNDAFLSFGDLARQVENRHQSSDFVERRILLIVGKIVIRF